jgi:hypothetical protein
LRSVGEKKSVPFSCDRNTLCYEDSWMRFVHPWLEATKIHRNWWWW